ncbi:MAG: ABC transporter permease [Promethearchaeota archaeon]
MFSDSLSLGLRFIGRSHKHCFSAVKAIAVLILIIMCLSALLNGAGTQFLKIVLAVGDSEYLYIIESQSNAFEDSFIDKEVMSALQNFQDSNIAGYLPQTYIYDETRNIDIWGVNITTLRAFRSGIKIVQGTGPHFVGSNLLNNILNASLPYTLELTTQSGEDKSIEFTGEIYSSSRYDDSFMIPVDLTYTLAPRLENHFSIIEVRVVNPDYSDETRTELESFLLDSGYNVDVRAEQQAQTVVSQTLSDVLTIFDFFVLFLFIIVLIRIEHAISWLTSIYEREIKVMRILGTSQNTVILLFVFMALIIGNLAFGLALIISLPLPTAITAVLGLITNRLAVSSVITIGNVVSLYILTNVFVVIGALYPSWKISRQNLIQKTDQILDIRSLGI